MKGINDSKTHVKAKKTFTKKQKILMIIAVIAAGLAVIAVSIALSLTLINNNEKLSPEITNFDEINDAYVKISWQSVKNNKGYKIEYYFDKQEADKSNIITGKTSANYYNILRRKGVLAYRIGVIKSDSITQFSDWEFFNIVPIYLGKTSSVTLNNDGILSWTKVRYLDVQTLKDVSAYSVNIIPEGSLVSGAIGTNNITLNVNSFSLVEYLKGIVLYEEGVDTWEDIKLNVKIKALNYGYEYPFILKDGTYEYLYTAYEEGDYYDTVLIIDEQKFRDIKG